MKRLLPIVFIFCWLCQPAWGELPTEFSFDETSFEVGELELDMSLANRAPSLSLTEGETWSASASTSASPSVSSWVSSNFNTHEGVKPYRFIDDLSFAGVPLFVAGIIAKQEKHGFRQDYKNDNPKLRLVSHFKTTVDNYTQYAPLAATAALNLAGVKGRSSFLRMGASSLMSYAVMAGLVNGIKYTSKEMRPDGSTANSWPSGHTATAFTAATILHKEYGMTVSPWYSVGAYAVATATGAMRVLNNRHWVSDVLSGAGIGIMSGELGYALCDLIFKGKGLYMNDLGDYPDIYNDPSFFAVSMGIGIDNHKTLSFTYDNSYEQDGSDMRQLDLKFRNSTVLGIEGAYFFNKYVGVGGRLKIRTTPVGNFPDIAEGMYDGFEAMQEYYDFFSPNLVTDVYFDIESDHLTEFVASVGPYFNLPLGKRFALGTKFLAGRSTTNALDIDATYYGNVYRDDKMTDEEYDITWNALTVDANSTFSWGSGLSLTFAYRSNFSWRAFVDYDHTRKTYTMSYLEEGFWPAAYPAMPYNEEQMTVRGKLTHNMATWTLGGSFVVSF